MGEISQYGDYDDEDEDFDFLPIEDGDFYDYYDEEGDGKHDVDEEF